MDFRLTDAQQALQDRARAFAERVVAPLAAETDRSEVYPWDTVAALADEGFMGMTIPKEFGGAGASYLDACLVIEELARVCGVTGRIAVEANMGALGAIMAYGTLAQKTLAAGLVLKGDKPAICITEPEAGSAANEMATRADKRGDRYIVNGRKHWITGGGVSRLHLVFARVFDEAGREQGIGGFIALRDQTKGLVVGKREPAMGMRGLPETEIVCDNMEVSADALVTGPRGLRHGFGALMDAYNAQRVGAATVALGLAQGAYELALARAQTRRQFGRAICEFQGLQWMLADMAVALQAGRLMVHRAAASGAGDFPDPLAAAQAKVFVADMAIKTTNDALQIFGAAGYSRNNPLERMARDARMFTIGGGTAQILRTQIAARVLERKLPQAPARAREAAE